MTQVRAGMTVSLDGFVEDGSGSVAGLAVDVDVYMGSEEFAAEVAGTGAVVMGRRTFDMAPDPDDYAENYEFQVSLFVVTHDPPASTPRANESLSVTFVTSGVEAAIEQARAAAGERDVTVVGGPG